MHFLCLRFPQRQTFYFYQKHGTVLSSRCEPPHRWESSRTHTHIPPGLNCSSLTDTEATESQPWCKSSHDVCRNEESPQYLVWEETAKLFFLSKTVFPFSTESFLSELTWLPISSLVPHRLQYPPSMCWDLSMSTSETCPVICMLLDLHGKFQSLQIGSLMKTRIVGHLNKDLTNHSLLIGCRKPVSM